MPNRNDEQDDVPEAFLPPREVMRRLGISRPTLRRWDETGRLSAVRLPSGHRRYRPADVAAALAAATAAATTG